MKLTPEALGLLRFLYRRKISMGALCSALHASELSHINDLQVPRRELQNAGLVTVNQTYFEITLTGLQYGDANALWTQLNAFGTWLDLACFFAKG